MNIGMRISDSDLVVVDLFEYVVSSVDAEYVWIHSQTGHCAECGESFRIDVVFQPVDPRPG